MIRKINNLAEEQKSHKEINKTRKKKKRKKKNWLLRIIIFIILCVALYYFFTSTIFDVDRIEVKSNNYYTSEQIIQMSGAKVGVNLFKAETRQMKEMLLTDSYMKNVSVKRTIPSTITIIVEERKEATVIPYGDKYIILDKNGLVLRHSDIEPKITLLLGMTIKEMTPGKALLVEENSVLTDTLFMLQSMENNDMYFKKIDITNIVIKAYIYDNLICEGTPEDILSSMENGTLQIVLKDLFNKGVERGIIKVGRDNYCSFSPMV
jgi:cell division protein FtsQ